MRAVRYDRFGGIDVLEVREVDPPVPGPDEVLVAVRAAGINPGEAKIREGAYAELWPSVFPSGQGSDLAGVVDALGPGVTGWAPGDEVIGWVDDRSSQAELVAVPVGQLVRKPDALAWEQAGALHVAGATAWAAVEAVGAGEGDVVVVSGAAGGVGSLAVQLAAARGGRVIGLAGPANHEWLTAHGALPVAYGDGVEERIRAAAPDGVDAFIDTHGDGYVDLALALGVATGRIDTIADFAAAERTGVRTEGNAAGARPEVIAELAARLADGRLDMPVAATYPLDRVRDAYRELERGHVRGKIVLIP
ncbi:MAG TPA: NADP-dependent oxidoreductase [Miltoncostaea sp.]|nr:NADP-dependent oxidoreductase [Miltoncostaea sp.]